MKIVGLVWQLYNLCYICGEGNQFDCKNLIEVFDGSFKCLQIDYVDFYQLYWFDCSMIMFGCFVYLWVDDVYMVLIEEMFGVFVEFVKVGKVCVIGVLNEMLWGVVQFLCVVEWFGLLCIVSIQNLYSLLNCMFENGLLEFMYCDGVGLFVYLLFVFGWLFGKYENGVCLVGVCIMLFECFQCYSKLQVVEVMLCYVVFVQCYGLLFV